jgi:rubrerythrin
MNVLKIADIVDIGIEKEKARQDYYHRVSLEFDDPEMKDLFTKLRDWEAAHVKKFQAIRGSLNELDSVESYPGELDNYMKALVDDKLYIDVTDESFTQNVKTPVDAIAYGIGFEKDAILLFMELLSYIQSSDKEVILQLMEEERKHIVHLIKMRKRFQS